MALYDVIIIGGGGTGLTAAIYTSRANLKTLLFERLTPGGQIALTDLVENYPGFPEGIMGADISMRMESQAKKYGTEIAYEEVVSASRNGAHFQIKTAKGVYESRSVIVAAGASFRTLGVPGERELTGKGVSYCATCDGAFFKNKEIVVVGGGDSALQEGLFLTRFVSKLTVIHRRDQLRAGVILQERAKANPKIEFMWDSVVTAIEGKGKVEKVRVKHVKTQAERDFRTDGVFVFIGHDPTTKFLNGFVALDEKGYVKANGSYETSVPGVFVGGEARAGATRQLVSACGEGCAAALKVQSYLEKQELASNV